MLNFDCWQSALLAILFDIRLRIHPVGLLSESKERAFKALVASCRCFVGTTECLQAKALGEDWDQHSFHLGSCGVYPAEASIDDLQWGHSCL